LADDPVKQAAEENAERLSALVGGAIPQAAILRVVN